MNTAGFRLQKIQAHLKADGIDLAIISLPADIAYLTQVMVSQLEREAMLYISHSDCVLLHSPLLSIRPNTSFVPQPALTSETRVELLSRLLKKPKSRVGIQETDLKINELKSLQTHLKQATFIDISSLCAKARSVKTTAEISAIKNACHITARAMDWVTMELGMPYDKESASQNVLTQCHRKSPFPELLPLSQSLQSLLRHKALSELKLAQHIDMALSQLGSHSLAFPVHVAFDQHSASPHHQPTNKVLNYNSVVMLDFGAKVTGYCADMTRTICLSPTPPKQFIEIKKVVDLAYQKACTALNEAEIQAFEVDHLARNIITLAGYGQQFPHSTGHGLGLDIHEQPSLSPSNNQRLRKGMVVTIEPGIYLKNLLGYRFENTLAIN